MRYNVDIKQERIKKKLTQAQLGTMIGVSEKSVSKWETGKGEPSYENMEQLCDIFGLSMDKIDTQLSAFRKFQLKLNKYTLLIGILVNAFLVAINIILITRVNNRIVSYEFDNNIQYLIDQIIYFISNLVLSLATIGVLICCSAHTNIKRHILSTLTLCFLIVLYVYLIFRINYYYNFSTFILVFYSFYMIFYVYNLIVSNKKERAKVCYHQANSEDL